MQIFVKTLTGIGQYKTPYYWDRPSQQFELQIN